MTGVLMKRGNLDTDICSQRKRHAKMTAEIRVRLLQVGDQRLPANHQKLGERPGTESSHSAEKEPTLPTA